VKYVIFLVGYVVSQRSVIGIHPHTYLEEWTKVQSVSRNFVVAGNELLNGNSC
jgi:hypothetical protein